MAASAKAINSSAYYVEVSDDGGTTWEKLGELTGCSLSRNHEVRTTTDLYSGGAREIAEGLTSWELSGEGNVAYAAESGFIKPDGLHALWEARTEVDIRFTTANTGDFGYSGKAYITSLEFSNGSPEENQTYSVGFAGNGALVDAAVA